MGDFNYTQKQKQNGKALGAIHEYICIVHFDESNEKPRYRESSIS